MKSMNSLLMMPLLVSIVVLMLIALFFKRRKDNLSVDYDGLNTETVLLSPTRPFGLSVVFILIGVVFLAIFIDTITLPTSTSDTFLYVFLCLSILSIIAGIKLFIKRNHIIQFEITNKGILYRNISWKPVKGGRAEFAMFWGKKFSFIEYAQIQSLSIEKSWAYGDTIIVYAKDRGSFYLPFLYENKEQFNEVYIKLNSHITKHTF